jgi:uncharacterized RDD family membrane protein YckC
MAGPTHGEDDAPDKPTAPDPRPPTDDAPTQPTGIISAAPVGWSATDRPNTPSTDGPAVAWASPVAAPTAVPAVGEGLVIAGVFSRLVAFSIDIVLLGCITILIGAAVGVYRVGSTQALSIGVGLVSVAIDGLYFVLLWRSGWRATLGMRLIGIRVLQARDGAVLPLEAATVRWLALTGIVQLILLLPGGVGVYLLATTGTDPLRQGLHDRWAGSVVVQPAPGGSGAAVVGCLAMVGLALFLPFLALLLVNDNLRDILSQVGQSI